MLNNTLDGQRIIPVTTPFIVKGVDKSVEGQPIIPVTTPFMVKLIMATITRPGQLKVSVRSTSNRPVCVDCLFSRSPGQAPYGARSACAKRAAYPVVAPEYWGDDENTVFVETLTNASRTSLRWEQEQLENTVMFSATGQGVRTIFHNGE